MKKILPKISPLPVLWVAALKNEDEETGVCSILHSKNPGTKILITSTGSLSFYDLFPLTNSNLTLPLIFF